MSNCVQMKGVNGGDSQVELTSTQDQISASGRKKSHSARVKVLVLLVVFSLAAAIAACIAVTVVVQKQKEVTRITSLQQAAEQDGTKRPKVTTPAVPEDDSVCLTPECVVAAARVHQSLDLTVHPCDNFYEYACGGWLNSYPIPEDRSSISTFSALSIELTVKLKGLLETESGEGELDSVTKAKDLYKSCLDEDRIEQRGLEPLQILYDMYGKWPLLNNTWDESSFDLIDTMVALRAYGASPLIYQGVGVDLKNASIRKLELDQPGFLLPGRDYYLSKGNESIPILRTYMVKLAEAFGAEDMNRVEQDVDAMLEFETMVANLTVPQEERRDYEQLYNLMTIDQLYDNITDQLNWLGLVGGMMNLSGVEIPISGEEPIIVYSPVYLKNVVDLIQKTPSRVLANYLLTWEIVSSVSSLPKNIRDIKTEYNKALYGTQTEPARWKRCVSVANGRLGNAVGRLFVDKYFDEDTKDIALDMIANIRSAFSELLTELDWMDDETRKVAKDKADAIKENIGYSYLDVKNDTHLHEQYKSLTYDSTTYFENILESDKWSTTAALKQLREPVDKTKWFTRPAIVNAFYHPLQNSITFPAGILQPPFFSKHYPKSMNFGGIGTVIGHEITHGFDDQGRLFDKNGDLQTWWSDSVSDRFKAKAQCIVDHYSNFTVPEIDMNVNGVNTQGENIADNGGLNQAFRAYRQWVKKQGKEERKLPGLDFTHNQLFFLSYAQVECSNIRKESMLNRILTGVHAPGKYRALGCLQNSAEFAQAFNCPKTSYMNPKRKCHVW